MSSPALENAVLGLAPWWSSAIASDLGLRCAAMAGGGALVLSVLLRALWNMRHPPAGNAARRPGVNVRERLAGESGTATVEFVLVFPAALFICLILLQTVLMFTGNLFVNYAAYAATRSAIVQAPDGRPGGGGQLVTGTPAYAAVQRAAAYAMVPVSGKGLDSDGADTTAGVDDAKENPAAGFVEGLDAYFDTAGSAPAWVNSLAGARMRYALTHTDIRVYETQIASNGLPELVSPESSVAPDTGQIISGVAFGPKDPVSIGVGHRLHLSVPYASAIFSDGEHSTQDGDTLYAEVFATCTMTLEGYDRALPPLPDVEREN